MASATTARTRGIDVSLPGPTPKPCNECPWRRAALPGWLGPFAPEEWAEIAHSDAPIACHETIKETNSEGVGDWSHPKMKQCAGAGIFRTNVFKSPRDPEVWIADESDKVTVFASTKEFITHHKEAWDKLKRLTRRRANA